MSTSFSAGSTINLCTVAAAAEPDQVKRSTKRKRSRPGNPDPNAEVIALTREELLATNRFHCEVCGSGFKRDQNLQLHLRVHNLSWELKKSKPDDNGKAGSSMRRKRVYVCPVPTCVHHQPEKALGDLTGIKKHYRRKHVEKKEFKCENCGKDYAVKSDYKAHIKICGTKSYKCQCETTFARKDSFLDHKALCQALAGETAKLIQTNQEEAIPPPPLPSFNPESHNFSPFPGSSTSQNPMLPLHLPQLHVPNPSFYSLQNLPFTSPPPAANLTPNGQLESTIFGQMDQMGAMFMQKEGVSSLTRDLLGLNGESSMTNSQNAGNAQVSMSMEGLLNCTMGDMQPGNPSGQGVGSYQFVRPSGPTNGHGGVGDDNQFAAAAFKLWE